MSSSDVSSSLSSFPPYPFFLLHTLVMTLNVSACFISTSDNQIFFAFKASYFYNHIMNICLILFTVVCVDFVFSSWMLISGCDDIARLVIEIMKCTVSLNAIL